MAQAYRTVYHSEYRDKLKDLKRSKPLKQDRFTSMLPEFGNWLIIKSLADQSHESRSSFVKAAEREVKNMYSNRNWSTYQVDYGHHLRKKHAKTEDAKPPINPEDELLEACRKKLSIKTCPVFPPRPTTRKLFGFIKPSLAHIGHSAYQEYHDSLGCDLLDKGKDKNIC